MAQTNKHKHPYPATQPGGLLTRALTRLLCLLLACQPVLAQAANGNPVLNNSEHPVPLQKLSSGGALTLAGARTVSGGDTLITARGALNAVAVQDQSSSDFKFHVKTGGLFGVKTNIREQSAQTLTRGAELKAGGALRLSTGAGLRLEAAALESGQETTLTAGTGQVALRARTDTDYVQKQRREEDVLWWNESDQGRVRETVRPVTIEAGGGLRINAGRGIVIDYEKTGDLQTSLGQLARAPGLSWITALQADPRVNWRAVEAEFREWDYEREGLTEAGAALMALATAAATWGASAKLSATLTKALPQAMQGAAMNASII